MNILLVGGVLNLASFAVAIVSSAFRVGSHKRQRRFPARDWRRRARCSTLLITALIMALAGNCLLFFPRHQDVWGRLWLGIVCTLEVFILDWSIKIRSLEWQSYRDNLISLRKVPR